MIVDLRIFLGGDGNGEAQQCVAYKVYMEKWEHNNVNTTDAPWEALKVSMEDQVATIPTPVRSDPTHAGPDDDTIPAVFFSPSGVVSTGSQSCDDTEDSSQDMEGCGDKHEPANANDHDVSC